MMMTLSLPAHLAVRKAVVVARQMEEALQQQDDVAGYQRLRGVEEHATPARLSFTLVIVISGNVNDRSLRGVSLDLAQRRGLDLAVGTD